MTLSWRTTTGPINPRTYTRNVISHQLDNWPQHPVGSYVLANCCINHSLWRTHYIWYRNEIFKLSITKGSWVEIVNTHSLSPVNIPGASSSFPLQCVSASLPKSSWCAKAVRHNQPHARSKECPQYHTHRSPRTTRLHTITHCWLI